MKKVLFFIGWIGIFILAIITIYMALFMQDQLIIIITQNKQVLDQLNKVSSQIKNIDIFKEISKNNLQSWIIQGITILIAVFYLILCYLKFSSLSVKKKHMHIKTDSGTQEVTIGSLVDVIENKLDENKSVKSHRVKVRVHKNKVFTDIFITSYLGGGMNTILSSIQTETTEALEDAFKIKPKKVNVSLEQIISNKRAEEKKARKHAKKEAKREAKREVKKTTKEMKAKEKAHKSHEDEAYDEFLSALKQPKEGKAADKDNLGTE